MTLKAENLESGNAARTAWTVTPADTSITALDPYRGKLPGLADGAVPEGRPCRRIIVLGSGTLVFTGLDGVDVTLPAAGSAFVFDVQATGLKASGTTATNVVLVW